MPPIVSQQHPGHFVHRGGSLRGTRRRSIRLVTHLAVALIVSGLVFMALPQHAAHAAANAIQIENSQPGDPTWDNFASVLQDNAISGYGSQISVNHGQSINFYVTTTAQSFNIDIYRTGWYGGTGARHMLALGTFQGMAQPIPPPDPVTGMIACNWNVSATLNVPSNWTTGVYLAKLTTNTGNSSFIMFVVRDDGGHEDIAVQTSVTTYESYNSWGGLSAYSNLLSNKSLYPYAHATKVSFDRPFSPGDSNGAGQYLFFEYPFVRWAEEQGFDLTYLTNIDVHTNVNPVTNHKVFLSLGHDEYWSQQMRTNVQNAISAGVNVAFFSANSAFWQIRLEPNANGVANRVQVVYKDFAEQTTAPGPDPQWNVNNAIVTTNFRDPIVNQPENGMLGVMYEDQNKTDMQPYVVTDASSWVFANTGFVNGTSIPGIVGYEYDKVWNNGFSPPGLTVLSKSPLVGQDVGPSYSNSTIYTAASGAQVFASGTIEWSYGLDNWGGRTTANAGIQQTTANILYRFSGETPPPPPPPPPPGTYLQDNFESGNLTLWTGPQGTGQATAEVTTVNAGNYAAALTNVGTTSGNYTQIYQNLQNSPGPQTYTRFYFNPNLTSSTATATLATGTDANGTNLWSVLYDGGRHGLDIYFWNGARTRHDLYSNTNVIAPNTWYAVEVYDNEATAGTGQVWLNGISIATTTGDLSATNDFTRLNLWNDAPGTIYFDDVKVANAYNGLIAGNPSVALNPTSLSFGNQNVGATTSAQTLTLSNGGTGPLTVNSVTISGANAGDFAQTNTCGTTVLQGANCAINVTFTPGAAGARNAAVAISDNAGGSPQSIALAGTGVVSTVHLNPTSVNFGNQNLGTTSTAQAITLTNSGTSALSISSITLSGANASDFAQTNTCGTTVAAGANCAISVTFAPGAASSRSTSVVITDSNVASPQSVALSGTGVFPPLPAGTYLRDGFEGGNLALWSAPSGAGQATVQTATVNSGSDAAALTTTSGQTVSLYGNLQNTPGTQTYSRFYFNVTSGLGTSTLASGTDAGGTNLWVIWYDAGRQGLDIYAWNGARARYDLYSNTNLVVPNTWYAVELALNETTTGSVQVWLNGNSIATASGDLSATNGYSRLYLQNQGVGTTYFDDVQVSNAYNGLVGSHPGASLSPASVSFGNQNVGATSAAQAITLTNSGTAALTINGITLTGANAGDFAQTNTCGASLAAGANCAINVTFGPTAAGARSASLQVSDNAPGNPQAVAVSGTGVQAVVGLNPTSLTFGNQNAGTTSAAQAITLTNNGTSALSISSIAMGGANAGDFAQTNTCGASVPAGGSCGISVTFTPLGGGARTASVLISDNAPGSPQAPGLSGTGVAPPPPPGTYLQDGFESGNLGLWSNPNGTGQAGVETTNVHSGSDAAALTDGAGQYVAISQNLAGGPEAQTFSRFYVYLGSGEGTTPIAAGTDGQGNNLWVIWYDAGRQGLDVYVWNGARTRYDLYSNTNVIALNTWYAVEINLNETTTGSATVWLNGTQIITTSADLSVTNAYSQVVLMNQATGAIDFDDVKVANAYNGL